jgi:hypothetical protein
MSSFFLFDYRNFLKNVIYLLKVHALGFLLLGFWLIPLIGNIHYTTAYADRWFIKSMLEIFPPILWPCITLTALGIIMTLFLLIQNFKFDALVKNPKIPFSVIPAKAGIQFFQV